MEGGGNSGLIYGLEYQCRALTSLETEDDSVRFAVGTQGPRSSNQVLFEIIAIFYAPQIHVGKKISDSRGAVI